MIRPSSFLIPLRSVHRFFRTSLLLCSVIASLVLGADTVRAQAQNGAGSSGAKVSELFTCTGSRTLAPKDAKTALAAVQRAYEKVTSLHASFSQESFVQALDLAESSGGEVWFVKPGKMRWHYKSPQEQVFTLKDGTLWLYQVADRQLVIDELRSVLLSDLPVSFLMGIGDLSERFAIAKACKGGSRTLFELTPTSSTPEGKSAVNRFTLMTSTADSLPEGAQVVDSSGNITSILLSARETNPAVRDTLFDVSVPKGTDVQDRRRAHDGSSGATSQDGELQPGKSRQSGGRQGDGGQSDHTPGTLKERDLTTKNPDAQQGR